MHVYENKVRISQGTKPILCIKWNKILKKVSDTMSLPLSSDQQI